MRFLATLFIAFVLAGATAIVPGQAAARAAGGDGQATAIVAAAAAATTSQGQAKHCRAGAGLIGCPFAAPGTIALAAPAAAIAAHSGEPGSWPAGRTVRAVAPPPRSVSD